MPEDGFEVRVHRALVYALRLPLPVVTGRMELLRRRLQQGRDPTRLEAGLAEIELARVRLAVAIDRLDGRA